MADPSPVPEPAVQPFVPVCRQILCRHSRLAVLSFFYCFCDIFLHLFFGNGERKCHFTVEKLLCLPQILFVAGEHLFPLMDAILPFSNTGSRR